MTEFRYPTVPKFQTGRESELLRWLAQSVNGLLDGHSNNFYRVTLTPDALETTVIATQASVGQVGIVQAQNAAAQGESIWVEVKSEEFVIHHESKPAADRDVGVMLHG